MKKRLPLLTSLLGAMLTVACTTTDSQYSVIGTSSQANLEGNIAYMKRMDRGSYHDVDSCEVIHGNFQMSGPLDSVMCVSIFMGETYNTDNRPILVVLEQGDVKVDIDYASVRAGGTPLNDKLYAFLASRDSIGMLLTDPNLTRIGMMVDGYSAKTIQTRMQQVEKENQKLYDALNQLEARFVENNYDNVLGVTWFLRMCEQSLFTFNEPANPYLKKIYKRAPDVFKNNPNVQRMMRMLK